MESLQITPVKKKNKKNFPRKISRKLHLWAGLGSGAVIFIISITGCLYAFKTEIENSLQDYRLVRAENRSFASPSFLKASAEKVLPGKKAHSVIYGSREKAAEVVFYSRQPSYYYIAWLNPYTGTVLKARDMDQDFFRIVLNGHFYLWLPPEIGKPVIASATLIFVFMIISGLVLWWPASKNAARQRFSIKTNGSPKRINYDLHNVLGFYSLWILIFLAITGLVWGFDWFAKSYYFTISGGKQMKDYTEPVSAMVQERKYSIPEDEAWTRMSARYPDAASIEIHYRENDSTAIACHANPEEGTFWKTDYVYFDQYTLQEKEPDHLWGKLEKTSAADKLMRLNYDIHVGAIAGLPGKCLAFFASLIAASLPVTGLRIWLGRRKSQNLRSS